MLKLPEEQDTGGPGIDCSKSTGLGVGRSEFQFSIAECAPSSHFTSEGVDKQ